MVRIGWILLALILGIILAGCARNHLTIVAKSVQYIEGQPVEFEVQYAIQ